MKVSKKSRRGRNRSNPVPHKGANHRNYKPSPAKRQKDADRRRRIQELREKDWEVDW